ncbi:MAG: WecB/TagA/CpsF family glycosyltransferase [Mycobacteriales bacterium]|nr:WecB/TagA/CpsF family glycosyltransferase [Frankia sp.]
MAGGGGEVRPRCPVGHAWIDVISYVDAVDRIVDLARTHDGRRHVVVTPNIHHIVELEHNPRFRSAYANAALVVPDGAPVARAVGLLAGRRQPRIAGSDLVDDVCHAAAAAGLTVGLLGGQPGAGEAAARRLREGDARLRVTLVEPAPHGFENDARERQRIIDDVRRSDPDILLVGLGAPKQEIFADEHAAELGGGVAVCVGAAIDFTGGAATRAPRLWRRLGLEWLWRTAQEPRRLAPRYAVAAPRFVRIVAPSVVRALLGRRRSG